MSSSGSSRRMLADSTNHDVVRLGPRFYIHILDTNTHVTRVEVGPQTFTRKDHESIVLGPKEFIVVPPGNYCEIENPVERTSDGSVLVDGFGQSCLRIGHREIRYNLREPFPLYPGEKLVGDVRSLTVIPQGIALRLKAYRDFNDFLAQPSRSQQQLASSSLANDRSATQPLSSSSTSTSSSTTASATSASATSASAPIHRTAGEEWLFRGPGTYIPQVEVEVLERVEARVIRANQALRLRARRDCFDDCLRSRRAGEEWLVRRTGEYLPDVEEEIVRHVDAYVLTDKEALHLRALRTFTDVFGRERRAGEEWLVTLDDAECHVPDVYEEVVGVVGIVTLNSRQYAVVLDPVGGDGKPQFGRREVRKGETSFFLKPGERLEAGIQEVYILPEDTALLVESRERFMDEESRDTIDGDDDVYEDDDAEEGDDDADEESGSLNRAVKRSSSTDLAHTAAHIRSLIVKRVLRNPGDRWMIHGPTDYIPRAEVKVIERRSIIALDENEGVYVRDLRSGQVRAVIGTSYMLQPHEELWAKSLPTVVEDLIASGRDPLADRVSAASASSGAASGGNDDHHDSSDAGGDGGSEDGGDEEAEEEEESGAGYGGGGESGESPSGGFGGGFGGDDSGHRRRRNRDPTRVVTFRAPHNSAVQVYDYKNKSLRVVFGPDLVMLQPDEQFTVLSLSGGKPKIPGQIKSMALLLGPDFMTDIINVETCDHARLSMQLSYNWYFDVDRDDEDSRRRIFQVPDFVGDACKAIASRIRGAVAAETFDNFHKQSAKIIRRSVFGVDSETGKVNDRFKFNMNNLCITNIDIQSVEPIDRSTRESLQKSVQLAIKITTDSQEASARQEAERLAQEACGRLERQKLSDQAAGEELRKHLLQIQAESAAVESTGRAMAEAKARAEAARVGGQAHVEGARLKAEADEIESTAQYRMEQRTRDADFDHTKRMYELELDRQRQLSTIQVSAFRQAVEALGADTIKSIAQAGPEMQAKLLSGLGLQGFLITDGKSPINLFSTADGLISRSMIPNLSGGQSTSS